MTSRSDGKSGIRLFRCDLPGPFRASLDGGDVDVIHHGHRYVVLPPSLHPEGRTYALFGPDGQRVTKPPTLLDLPLLPVSWHEPLYREPPRRHPSRRTARPEPAARPARTEAQERQLLLARSVLDANQGKRYRDDAGVRIEDLALELGVNRARASHLEMGHLRSPSNALLIRYGAILERILSESPELSGRAW